MAEALDIRTYTASKAIVGVADISIVSVRMTVGECLVVGTANGEDVLVGPITILETVKVQKGCVAESKDSDFTYDGIDIDDIRVITAIYVVQGGAPIELESASFKEGKFFIKCAEKEVVVLDISNRVATPLKEVPLSFKPPLFCNTFSSILKVVGGGQDNPEDPDNPNSPALEEITERIVVLEAKDIEIEKRLKVVEQSSGVIDLTEITTQLQNHDTNLRKIDKNLNNIDIRVASVEAKAKVGVVNAN